MSAVDDLLAEARAELDRVEPAEAERLHSGGATLLVDIRPYANRAAEGEIPGAVPVERIVLEWRLDPHGDHRLPGFTEDSTVIVFCNDGWASSLAARELQRLGLRRATEDRKSVLDGHEKQKESLQSAKVEQMPPDSKRSCTKQVQQPLQASDKLEKIFLIRDPL